MEEFRRLIQYWIVKDGRTGGHFVIAYCTPCIASPGKNSAVRVLNFDSLSEARGAGGMARGGSMNQEPGCGQK